MVYQGKNPRNNNGNGGAGATITCTNCNRNGHLAKDCRTKNNSGNNNNNNNNNGNKQCDNCGPNRTHTTGECFKNKNKNKPSGDSAKPPSRPCSHCQGSHYDNQCPNNNSGNTTQSTGKTPSRPCRHCQALGHFDSSCPTLNNGSQPQPTLSWQTQIQPFNQPCPTCGAAHQASQCPNKPAPPKAPQYISSTTELYAQIGQLINANNGESSLREWYASYYSFCQQALQQKQEPLFVQQQYQVPAQPMVRWANNGENFQFAEQYEETSAFSQQSASGSDDCDEHSVDVDGDVMMY